MAPCSVLNSRLGTRPMQPFTAAVGLKCSTSSTAALQQRRPRSLACRCEAAPDGSSLPPRQRIFLSGSSSNTGIGGGKPSKPVIGYPADGATASSSSSTQGTAPGSGGTTSCANGASTAPLPHNQQAQQQQVVAAEGPGDGSWQDWKRHMQLMDDLCQVGALPGGRTTAAGVQHFQPPQHSPGSHIPSSWAGSTCAPET